MGPSVFTLEVTNCSAGGNRSFEFPRFQLPDRKFFPLLFLPPGFESAGPHSQMEPVVFAGERDAIHDHFKCRHEREQALESIDI